MNKKFKITIEAKLNLEEELEQLKSSRGEIAEKISQARDFGDLRENAEYDAAKNEQGIAETRIVEIENILRNAEIITKTAKGKVDIGSTVTLKNSKKEVVYMVVDPIEADPLERKISPESPLGSELMGKKINDTINIVTPKATTKYEIVLIS